MPRYSTLVSTATVATHIGDADWCVVDCRFDLADPDAGARAYAEAHVPGAVYARLDRDLSGPPTGSNGRHPLPELEAWTAVLGRLGIGSGVQVVVYDEDVGGYAARLWWMLRHLGHDGVALLDGGFAKWRREGRAVRAGLEVRVPRRFAADPRRDGVVTADEILRRQGDPSLRLIDARSPERYRGEVEPIDRVAGHIPGAVNHPYRGNVAADGTLLPVDELRRRLSAAAGDGPASEVVVYCGSGVTACHDLLALAHAGFGLARLYAGSWSEWSSDPARPVERG